MKIAGNTALLTGANRGLGARIVNELLAADVAKVYATARTLGSIAGSSVIADPRVEPLALDITDPVSVRAAAAAAADVTVLVNNAGVLAFGGVLDGDLGSFASQPVGHDRALAPPGWRDDQGQGQRPPLAQHVIQSLALDGLLPEARPEQLGRDHDLGSASRHPPPPPLSQRQIPRPAACAGWRDRARLARPGTLIP